MPSHHTARRLAVGVFALRPGAPVVIGISSGPRWAALRARARHRPACHAPRQGVRRFDGAPASRPLSTVPVGFLKSRRNHHFTVPLEDKMATTRTTLSNPIVKITPNDKGNPPGKLADAEFHFGDGPLAGLKLTGFSAPRQR
jgi:hypothetical protein